MNLARLVVVGALLLLVSSIAMSADSQPASKPSTGPAVKLPQGYWTIRASYAKADDAQRAKIKELTDAEKSTLYPLEIKLAGAEKALDDAKAAGKKDAVEKAAADRKSVQDEIDAVKAKNKTAVMAVFTPAQREMIAAHDLVAVTKRRLAKMELTEAQDAKIMELASAVAKKVIDAKDDDKAVSEIRQAFLAQVKEQVLTPEQRNALEAASKPAASNKSK